MLFQFFLYLFYGLAFFTLGISVIAKEKGVSNLKIAKFIWLLGAFGITHGLHEWLELYSILERKATIYYYTEIFLIVRIAVVSISFIFLLLFGIRLIYTASGSVRRLFLSLYSKLVFLLVLLVVINFLPLELYLHSKLNWFQSLLFLYL